MILFGVTSGTIMVAIVIMLVILCQRKQRNNKQSQVAEKPDVTVTAEELYKENDRNSNISELKMELRQANGSCEVVSKRYLYSHSLFMVYKSVNKLITLYALT